MVGGHRFVTQLALAQALADRHDLDHDDDARVQASLAFRTVVRDARQTEPGAAIVAALYWSTWALNRQAWPEVEAAAVGGMAAMQQLVRGQSRREAKQDWIRNAQDLSVRAAVARHRRGDAPGAVVALEAGRALLLDESLDRTRLDLGTLARRRAGGTQGNSWALRRCRPSAGAICLPTPTQPLKSATLPTP